MLIDIPIFQWLTLFRGWTLLALMEGRTYHHVFSTDTNNYEHPAQWLLYDDNTPNPLKRKADDETAEESVNTDDKKGKAKAKGKNTRSCTYISPLFYTNSNITCDIARA